MTEKKGNDTEWKVGGGNSVRQPLEEEEESLEKDIYCTVLY